MNPYKEFRNEKKLTYFFLERIPRNSGENPNPKNVKSPNCNVKDLIRSTDDYFAS